MGIIDIKLDKAKLGDLAKLNIFYNGNLESKLLLKALEDLLENTNTKVIAYTSKKKGTYLPYMQLFLVDKDYKKPYFRIDIDKCLYVSDEFVNKKAVGKDSEQYKILTDIYIVLIEYLREGKDDEDKICTISYNDYMAYKESFYNLIEGSNNYGR